jgi:hypothetical protein
MHLVIKLTPFHHTFRIFGTNIWNSVDYFKKFRAKAHLEGFTVMFRHLIGWNYGECSTLVCRERGLCNHRGTLGAQV